ncbi:glycoside hydrolase family 43 protein [Puniceicoccales bacterium CK1056]|uniref:Glycoside hydrolase family 43 protein n=1 Tax=Oceanipulchritudo coccoides TaxID=2706888 RepID=A0A6B2M1D2_9BACT|nr:glycoside hydrolase family 43 protein [Oceanipulchritudo coccoides]NDV61877.1 glycoside hydrolase family 43 protein [Oceanipulchritudo coccoides]
MIGAQKGTETGTIQNPILRGFNPDPSILRVGKDYYIATSTFEWFPGVQIHHSRDLANWRLITRPLTRRSQLDMLGNPDSGGVWAPCLSHCDGKFHLIYSNVRRWKEDPYKVVDNFLVTAPAIDGPWSEPIYLNSTGFDPSLFHDEDGRKWLVSMEWDHRKGRDRFSGILLQEFSPAEKKLIGPVQKIFKGTEIGLVEGPHLYRLNGYYYLLTAEGGTQYQHAVSLCRSRQIEGPYEIHPENPLLTSYGKPELNLQKAGHGSLVETPEGEWYLAHLCGRPVDGRHCILGRETALQKCNWKDDGWIYLESGGSSPQVEVTGPLNLDHSDGTEDVWDGEFSPSALDIHFQSLRQPITEDWCSLTERPGWLRLKGFEPTTSQFRQSLIARRVQAFTIEASTEVDFKPEGFNQMAGLIAYYDTENHYYLRLSHDEKVGRSLNIIQTVAGPSGEILSEDVPVPSDGSVHLRVRIEQTELQFYFSLDGESWTPIGPVLESTILSDDFNHLGFTGAFVGMCAQDFVRSGNPADFKYFKYQELSLP